MPGSWHRALKTLGISWVTGVSFIHNQPHMITPTCIITNWVRVGSRTASGWGPAKKRPATWLEGGNFQPYPSTTGRGGGWRLCRKNSGASGMMNALMCWEGGVPKKGTQALHPPPQYPDPWASSVWLFLRCILGNKPLTVKCFPGLQVITANYQAWWGDHGNPKFKGNQIDQKYRWPRTCDWRLKWMEPFSHGICTNTQ